MDNLICNSCNRPKANLQKRKSKIITSMDILMCNACINSGYEPRHLLIIGYHSEDPFRKKAIGFIKDNLYLGDRISLSEVL